MAAKLLPSQDYLRQCFMYDDSTGLVCWAVRPASHFSSNARRDAWNVRHAGKRAGGSDGEGYLTVKVDGRRYLLHRLIWKMLHGEDPDVVDHVNRNRSDNRAVNLRSVDALENRLNRPHQLAPIYGRNGVKAHRNRYQSRVRLGGVVYYLGSFESAEMAEAAYLRATEVLYSPDRENFLVSLGLLGGKGQKRVNLSGRI